MGWSSFFMGGFIGFLLGFMAMAIFQFLRERREDGDDYLTEVDALWTKEEWE